MQKNKRDKIILLALASLMSFCAFINGYYEGSVTTAMHREFYEIEAQLISKENYKKNSEKENKKIAELAFYCREQISIAMEKISNDRTDVIDNIINAKKFLKDLKEMGIPTNRYEEDLRAVEIAFKAKVQSRN